MDLEFLQGANLKKVELLAPAGNLEALKAAVESGADAVYLAGSNFGARAYADNFTPEELKDAVKFAHLRGVATHVTVNTIVANPELSAVAEYIKFLDSINVDAVLVQDLGVAALAKRIAPTLPLHASTQMTVHSLEGVKFLESLGFSRVVLSRELSISEIQYICENSTAEIEIFVHGALCVCYSGQCLLSSMIGARSGNRGRCAQPCRMPYELVDKNGVNLLEGKAGQYLLSPKDLNALELLPKLIAAGVDSLKIEGRMKRAEYVAVVVETYRTILDGFLCNNNFFVPNQYKKNLAQMFNRDFTTAYLECNQGKQMISDMRPNNRGVLIGRVVDIGRDFLTIKTNETIHADDQLEVWVKVGGRLTLTVSNFTNNSDGTVKIFFKPHNQKVSKNDRVFKVFDAVLTAHARKLFTSSSPIRRISVDVEVTAKLGQPLQLKMTDFQGNAVEVTGNVETTSATNKPLDYELINRQLSRLGNTVYELRTLNTNLDDNLMVPVSELNDLRRRATSHLDSLRLKAYERPKDLGWVGGQKIENLYPTTTHTKLNLIVAVDSIEPLKIAISAGADSILFGGESYHHKIITPQTYQQAIDIAHSHSCKLFIATPRIVRQPEQSALEEILKATTDADSIYIHNVATLNLTRRLTDVAIHTDYSLIAFNLETINLLSEFGVKSVTLSPELTFEQVKALAKSTAMPLECIVHGRLELMISSYCVLGSFLGGVGEHKCSEPCRRQSLYLRDRMAAMFPLATDQFCRMHILNSKMLSMLPHVADFKAAGISAIRIDGRALTNEELTHTVEAYRRAIDGAALTEENTFPKLDFTRGHYFRGVTTQQ